MRGGTVAGIPSEEHEIKRESVVQAYGIFFLSQKQQCQYEI